MHASLMVSQYSDFVDAYQPNPSQYPTTFCANLAVLVSLQKLSSLVYRRLHFCARGETQERGRRERRLVRPITIIGLDAQRLHISHHPRTRHSGICDPLRGRHTTPINTSSQPALALALAPANLASNALARYVRSILFQNPTHRSQSTHSKKNSFQGTVDPP